MNKKLIISTSLITLGVIILLHSCKKSDLPINLDYPQNVDKQSNNIVFVEPSERIINGELFIDDISQKEVITDFDIEGVKVIDGRLAFKDHATLIKAIDKLADHNTESVVAWSKKVGFNSLFTELTRIEEKPFDKIQQELNKDMYKEYFYISEHNTLELSKHSHVHARVFNTQGLIQVGEFVGTISNGLNVWVKSDNVNKLVDALRNHEIPKGDKDFIVADKQAFDDYKNWVALENCPKTGNWLGPIHQYKNPNDNRRIDVQNHFESFYNPNDFGSWDGTVRYNIYTTSRKASWNKYKTNHYLSIDIRTQHIYSNGSSDPIIIRQNTDTGDTNTKYGNIVNHILSVTNMPYSYFQTNAEVLVETIAGSSGMTGTAASHRGMNDLWGRQECK